MTPSKPMNEYELWYYDKDFNRITLCYKTAGTPSKAKGKAFVDLYFDCDFLDFVQGLHVKKLGKAPFIPPSVLELESQVEKFNKDVPVGSAVKVKMDDGSIKETITTHPATILSDHSAVAWLKDISGCYLLDRVTKTA